MRIRTTGAAILAVAALAGSHIAEAQSGLSLQDFVRIAGEVAETRLSCNRQVDMQRLQALGKPHQVAPGDKAKEDAAADMIARSMLDANARRRQMGEQAFCAAMIAQYGPGGTVAQGLVK